jgi:drug/metabolite transporter (DMT)-like permease
MALLCALLIVVIDHQIRDLGRTEEPITIVFYFAALGTPLAAIALPFFAKAHNAEQWLVLLGIGTFGTLGTLLMSASLRFGAVASIVVMDYTQLIWATPTGGWCGSTLRRRPCGSARR